MKRKDNYKAWAEFITSLDNSRSKACAIVSVNGKCECCPFEGEDCLKKNSIYEAKEYNPIDLAQLFAVAKATSVLNAAKRQHEEDDF